jgi:hypothetical protein
LGFVIASGAEAAARALRIYVDSMQSCQMFIKIDALNMLRRDSTLEAVTKHFTELLPFAEATIGEISSLQFGDFVLQFEEGAQQDDPL